MLTFNRYQVKKCVLFPYLVNILFDVITRETVDGRLLIRGRKTHYRYIVPDNTLQVYCTWQHTTGILYLTTHYRYIVPGNGIVPDNFNDLRLLCLGCNCWLYHTPRHTDMYQTFHFTSQNIDWQLSRLQVKKFSSLTW